MKKMQYNQPKVETILLPEGALMEFQNSPTNDPQQSSPAPMRGDITPQGPGYKPF